MRIRTFFPAALLLSTSAFVLAQGDAPAYQKPPQAIVDVMDAAPLPVVTVSPLGDVIALGSRRSMPAVAELARPWLGLAGIRVNPANSGPRGVVSVTGLRLRTIATGAERPIQVPADARIGLIGFSPDRSARFRIC